jgi:hypothetical protein
VSKERKINVGRTNYAPQLLLVAHPGEVRLIVPGGSALVYRGSGRLSVVLFCVVTGGHCGDTVRTYREKVGGKGRRKGIDDRQFLTLGSPNLADMGGVNPGREGEIRELCRLVPGEEMGEAVIGSEWVCE